MSVGGAPKSNAVRALALLTLLAVFAPGCSRKAKASKHHAEEVAPVSAPTPDNTPVPALRTPAGMVLKLEEPTPATPPPTAIATVTPNPTP